MYMRLTVIINNGGKLIVFMSRSKLIQPTQPEFLATTNRTFSFLLLCIRHTLYLIKISSHRLKMTMSNLKLITYGTH